MLKKQAGKAAKFLVAAVIAAKLAFSSFQVLAEPPKEKARLSCFWQRDINKSRSLAGIGVDCRFSKSAGAYYLSNFMEFGIFAIAGDNLLHDEFFLKFGHLGKNCKYHLALVRNSSQNIGWGIEGGYFFETAKSLYIGASAIAFEVPQGGNGVRFYFKPAIVTEQGVLHARLAGIINYYPWAKPFVFARGVEAKLSASSDRWEFFALCGVLSKAHSDEGKGFVFRYARSGLTFEF
ncbi:MAG: hypothetical protein ABIH83_03795 [Candidatus Micrarchaeota archaeon]